MKLLPSSARNQALAEARSRRVVPFIVEKPLLSYFGERVFTIEKMKDRLPGPVYARLLEVVDGTAKMTREVADSVAHAALEWATTQGVTHFCHWFQPQTGSTAEKHDSFFAFDKGEPIVEFSGAQLMQSEPDASSFPSGGLRATHTARGYTAWDPASPMFINRVGGSATLCIPSVFVSYTGEALDEKLGLLRSNDAVEGRAKELLELIGDRGVQRINTTLGTEQEYFLVDRAYWTLRPDLQMCGRTLVGAKPPRGQQLEDHYFGSIPTRIQACMAEAELALYKLGVPVKTRHNEVAPSQFETAPIFESADVATDHNLLTMAVIDRVAEKHGMKAIFHEKPFAGLNGSGKHCNWSIAVTRHDGSYTGHRNLLEPGETPHENLRFILFLTAIIRAVDKHQGLLRASIASAANDHRLGANEAPPAIISAFLGDTLTRVVDAICKGETKVADTGVGVIGLGVGKLAELRKDNTDRNRTSPFAFTGNKFEFRAVGGSANVSFPITILNAVVADGIAEVTAAVRDRIGRDGDVAKAAMEACRMLLNESRRVCFDGNGYSDEWVDEAARRGLLNLKKTPESLAELVAPPARALLARHKVFSDSEVISRFHVRLESYLKRVRIEAETLSQLVTTSIYPSCSAYARDLIDTARAAKDLGLPAPQADTARVVQSELATLESARAEFESRCARFDDIRDEAELASFIVSDILPAMESVRTSCDRLETLVDDAYWPLPKYREMLFNN